MHRLKFCVRERVFSIFAAFVRSKDLANGDAPEELDLQGVRVDNNLVPFADTQT